jgi:DNA (cytosine-5)-methyltransferase 1
MAIAEIDPHASVVLKSRFPGVRNLGDVTRLKGLPPCDLVTAGFPCQDLSQAGRTAGIHGSKSGLIACALDLIEQSNRRPDWLLLENVPFMLSLHKGAAMTWLTRRLSQLGYRWAYRVIDARAFGVSQRRRRLFILASRAEDPANILFADSHTSPELNSTTSTPYGFYWTEGNRGVGWAADAVPPLKCSSGLNIASPPAIWFPGTRSIVTPTIEDAEALQGFRRGWSRPAKTLPHGDRIRWRLVGNAVPAPVTEWIGRQLTKRYQAATFQCVKMTPKQPWPSAGYGLDGARYGVTISEWPVKRKQRSIMDFISPNAPALSARATKGFYDRLIKSGLRAPPRFLEDLSNHINRYADHRRLDQQENVANKRSGQSARTRASISAL